MKASFSPLGDQAIAVELGNKIDEETEKQVRKLSVLLEICPSRKSTTRMVD